jgi:hypothetical protein
MGLLRFWGNSAARGLKGILGNLCRQGHNDQETCDPKGVRNEKCKLFQDRSLGQYGKVILYE